jgi:ABC-type amino acid transport substrate-binding protein
MKTKFINLIALLVLVFSFAGCSKNVDKVTGNNLFEDNTIRVGYISYPPGFIVDPNTKEKSGIFNDVLVEIAKRKGLKINYKEEVTWATMIEALKTHRVDLIGNPVWATKERRENADFSVPVYYSPIGIYVRADDDRFNDDRKKINDPKIKIAAIDGEIGMSIAQQDFPKAQLNPFPNNIDIAQLFLEVQSKKKDVVFAEPMFAYDYMQKNPSKLKNIAIVSPIRNYPNCFMYDKGANNIGEFLDKEIVAMIKDGTINRIIAKYEPKKGLIIRADDSLAVDIQ